MVFALPENLEWRKRWEERGDAVRRKLGTTLEPNTVTPFMWKDYILPGACGLTFGPHISRVDYMYVTLGLSQPLRPTDSNYPWEFAIRTHQHAKWPLDLLYQLVTQWLCEKGDIWLGYYLPLHFFWDESHSLWASISANVPASTSYIGAIRGLYLWEDDLGLKFTPSGGSFKLLNIVAVTEDEDRLAQETTPAHLMLLFKRLGISQVCNPDRQSVLASPAWASEWKCIKSLGADDALDEVRRARENPKSA